MNWSETIIISFSVDTWFGLPMGRHNIMREFSNVSRVYFCSRMWQTSEIFTEKKLYTYGLQEIKNNLYSYIPNKTLFTTFKYGFINDIQRKRYANAVLREENLSKKNIIILYIWHPTFSWVIDYFPHDFVVYHMYDDYASYSDMTDVQKVFINSLESQIIEKSDYVFSSHPRLLEKYDLKSKGEFIGNGVNFNLFSKCRKISNEIQVIRDQKKECKLVGYVGRITSKLDFNLLKNIVIKKQIVLVLVGPVVNIEKDDRIIFDELLSLDRVYSLGEKESSELPSYISGLDVCLLPYKTEGNNHVHAIYPLKLHEYFACGKPVIATVFNSHMLKMFFNDLIWGDEGRWLEVLSDTALLNNLESESRSRVDIARQNSWEQRVFRIKNIISNAMESI